MPNRPGTRPAPAGHPTPPAALDPAGNAAEPGSVAEIAVNRLEELGCRLGEVGWPARLRAEPDRVPCLHVQNPVPGCRALAEDIYAAPKQDGFWFWWSWAEPIAQTAEDAAAAITRVLRPASEL
jgi:hypothetical protein